MPLADLPTINIYEPIATTGTKTGTRTSPIDMICHSSNGNPDDGYISYFVVKLKNDAPYKEHTCARELIGSLLAIAFGLITPQPAVILISDDFWEMNNDPKLRDRLRESSGYNFGSRNVEINGLLGIYLPQNKYQEGADIFAFDALIQNPDRRIGNPNMFHSPDGFILYDHELAFPYSRPNEVLGGVPKPWELTDPRSTHYLRQHVFYGYLKGKQVSFDNHYEKLVELNEAFIDNLLSKIPDDWFGEEIGIIKEHLLLAHENAGLVKRGLQEVLV